MQVRTQLEQLAKRRYVSGAARALVYLSLGQNDLALDRLEKAFDEGDGEMPFLKFDPPFASLRNEPRFQALVKKVENGGKER